MKKIILGMTHVLFVPFYLMCGNELMNLFNISGNVLGLIGLFGAISGGFTFFMGAALVIQGYREKFGMFDGRD